MQAIFEGVHQAEAHGGGLILPGGTALGLRLGVVAPQTGVDDPVADVHLVLDIDTQLLGGILRPPLGVEARRHTGIDGIVKIDCPTGGIERVFPGSGVLAVDAEGDIVLHDAGVELGSGADIVDQELAVGVAHVQGARRGAHIRVQAHRGGEDRPHGIVVDGAVRVTGAGVQAPDVVEAVFDPEADVLLLGVVLVPARLADKGLGVQPTAAAVGHDGAGPGQEGGGGATAVVLVLALQGDLGAVGGSPTERRH